MYTCESWGQYNAQLSVTSVSHLFEELWKYDPSGLKLWHGTRHFGSNDAPFNVLAECRNYTSARTVTRGTVMPEPNLRSCDTGSTYCMEYCFLQHSNTVNGDICHFCNFLQAYAPEAIHGPEVGTLIHSWKHHSRHLPVVGQTHTVAKYVCVCCRPKVSCSVRGFSGDTWGLRCSRWGVFIGFTLDYTKFPRGFNCKTQINDSHVNRRSSSLPLWNDDLSLASLLTQMYDSCISKNRYISLFYKPVDVSAYKNDIYLMLYSWNWHFCRWPT